MGVDMTFMTVFGVKIEPNEESFMEAYNEAEDKHGPDLPDITYDGMCGEYLILGPVLYRFQADGDHDSTPDFKGTSVQELVKLEADYRVLFRRYFKNYFHLIEKVPFNIISFVHYT